MNGLAYKKIVQESGFTAAFGLQSGVASESSDFFALPRFTITEKYSDIDRFQMIAEALPFPVLEIQPADSYLTGGDTPIIGFSVPPIMAPGLKSLSCFISGEAQTSIHIVDTRVELRPSQPLTEDHVRVNCTMPGPLDDDDTQVWRWYGMLLVNPAIAAQDDDGEDEPSSPQPAELQ